MPFYPCCVTPNLSLCRCEMTQIIKNLNKYGRAVSFHSQNGEKICDLHAMISPLRYKNKMYLYGVNTEIGYNSQGHYLYIGPPTPDLTQISERDYLFSGEEKFSAALAPERGMCYTECRTFRRQRRKSVNGRILHLL